MKKENGTSFLFYELRMKEAIGIGTLIVKWFRDEKTTLHSLELSNFAFSEMSRA